MNILKTKITRERERDKKHLIVWGLFDDANSSYKNTIEKYFNKQIQIHSFGINDVKFHKSKFYYYHKIDLSLCNFNLINQLHEIAKKYGYPDIILASPPCESWSGADCNGKMFVKLDSNGNWIVKNKKFYDHYLKVCHPVKRRYFEQKEASRILGEATIGATILIIKTFNPKVWVIENPQTSKTWDYQEKHWDFFGEKNLTKYSCYDSNFSLKPTIFKSNIKLNLLNKKSNSGNNAHMAKGSYNIRSNIPHELIKSIVEQILVWLKK